MEAVKLVKEGKVFDLGNEYYKGFPAYPPRDVFVWLLVHGLTVDPPRGYDKATDMEEFVCMSTGLSTQLDGFAHVGHDHVFYNATKQSDIVSASGAKKFGMETVPPLVTRAVLVDMVDFLGRNLEPAEEISLKDFKACLAKHKLEIQPGDAVLVNTGWMRLLGKDNKKFASSNPGISEDIAWYLVDKGVVGVGTDQWCTEVYPHKGFPKDLYGAAFLPRPRGPAGQRHLSVPKPKAGRSGQGLQGRRQVRLLLQLHPPQDPGHGAGHRPAHRHQVAFKGLLGAGRPIV